jgi:hypothetical protein
VAPTNPDRSSYFPAIEKRYGLPMSHWFEVMDTIRDQKYPEQIAYLRENHGFSQAHANALVLYSRGNTTSRRFDTLDDYLAPCDPVTQETVRAMFGVLQKKFKRAEVVIAWNQPMLKVDGEYVFGLSVLKNYILMAPYGSGDVLAQFRDRLVADGYKVNKKTIQVPLDWKPDAKLLVDMAAARIAEVTA